MLPTPQSCPNCKRFSGLSRALHTPTLSIPCKPQQEHWQESCVSVTTLLDIFQGCPEQLRAPRDFLYSHLHSTSVTLMETESIILAGNISLGRSSQSLGKHGLWGGDGPCLRAVPQQSQTRNSCSQHRGIRGLVPGEPGYLFSFLGCPLLDNSMTGRAWQGERHGALLGEEEEEEG